MPLINNFILSILLATNLLCGQGLSSKILIFIQRCLIFLVNWLIPGLSLLTQYLMNNKLKFSNKCLLFLKINSSIKICRKWDKFSRIWKMKTLRYAYMWASLTALIQFQVSSPFRIISKWKKWRNNTLI